MIRSMLLACWFVSGVTFFLIGRVLEIEALFVHPPAKRIPYPDLRLASADRLGVHYTGFAHDAGKAASLPGFALSLDADFGTKLDEKTFTALQTTYCSWSETKSRVQYKPGYRYTLLDFLPPLLQAVSGLHFQSSRRKQPGLPSLVGSPDDRVSLYTQQEVLLTSNCWGFAWEVLFQADNADTSRMAVSTGDPSSAWRALTGPGFDLIQTSLTRPALLTDKALRNQKLQPGDVLLLWHTIASSNTPNKVYLDHVVTWIDDDVIFEKSGSGDKVPFRINTWEGLIRNFPPAVFAWEWRRLVRNNRNSPTLWQPALRLKPASQVFGVDSQLAAFSVENPQTSRFSFLARLQPSVAQKLSLTTDQNTEGVIEAQTFTGILELEDLVFDPETGRASLPPNAFTDLRLPKLPTNPYSD